MQSKSVNALVDSKIAEYIVDYLYSTHESLREKSETTFDVPLQRMS